MDKSVAAELIKKLRQDLGYTQEDVAEWISVSKSNYSRKEKVVDGVALTADEFLIILSELKRRGPKKQEINIESLLDDIIKK